jgi:hypothetical protein
MIAKMYVIGKEYNIQALKDVAETEYRVCLPDMWESTSFVASLKLLYEEATETDHAMKGIAVKVAGEQARELLSIEELVSLCKENGGIAVDVMKPSLMDPLKQPCDNCRAMCSRPSTSVQFKCNPCYVIFKGPPEKSRRRNTCSRSARLAEGV